MANTEAGNIQIMTPQSPNLVDSPQAAAGGPTLRNVQLEARGTLTQWMWRSLFVFGFALLGLFVITYVNGTAGLTSTSGQMLGVSAVATLILFLLREIRFPIGKILDFENNHFVLRVRNHSIQLSAPFTFVSGWYTPGTNRVELRNEEGDVVTAKVDNAAEAQALLDHFGVGAWYETMKVRLGSVTILNGLYWLVGPWPSMWIADKLCRVADLNEALAIPLMLATFLTGFLAYRKVFDPARITIGVDGVIVQQRFTSRFIPMDGIASISTTTDHITFQLKSGASIVAHATRLSPELCSIIEQRMRDAMAIRAQLSADAALLDVLDRGKRQGSAWHQALRGIFDRERGYRHAHLTPEQVTAVLVDPSAPPDRRIGAAMALAQSDVMREARTSIRWAAQTSANPKLRVALEAIAEGDLNHLSIDEAALAEAAAVEEASDVANHVSSRDSDRH